jgi:DNA modification methylase
MRVIYCDTNNKRCAEIAVKAGLLYGAQLPASQVFFDPFFTDQNWKKPQFDQYVAAVQQYKPHYATVIDWERKGQETEVMQWAEAIAPYTQHIIIIPKTPGVIDRIPHTINGTSVVLGYSVPTTYGGTAIPPTDFAGWQVHLLGGSPKAQQRAYRKMQAAKAEVVSVDGNIISKMAIKKCHYWASGQWNAMDGQDPRAFADEQYDKRYMIFEVSCQSIMREWHKLTSDKPDRSIFIMPGGEHMTNVINQAQGENWITYHGDCVETMKGIPDNSIDYSVFSPPFASLYTYSASERDMGNCRDHNDFAVHYRYLVTEQYRTLKPGRLLSFHCMQLPATKQYHGYIGLIDFRGELIRMYQDAGFIYHSEVVIWKDPVTAMQRTKALGLLYKQLKKDSAMSRQGVPDYLVTMRKPGINEEPITKEPLDYPVDLWQEVASPIWNYGENDPPFRQLVDWLMQFFGRSDTLPVWQRYTDAVWMDINPSDTLQYRSAREHQDERHICPLQLEVIRRAIRLWTNPGDTVLDPFGGIGSTPYCAIELGRRGVGIELKRSYFEQMCRNLAAAEKMAHRSSFFDLIEEAA